MDNMPTWMVVMFSIGGYIGVGVVCGYLMCAMEDDQDGVMAALGLVWPLTLPVIALMWVGRKMMESRRKREKDLDIYIQNWQKEESDDS